MAVKIRAVGAVAMLVLATWSLSQASAQTAPAKPPVDQNCCYAQKPRCEGSCPITDAEQRESCRRECEGRVRACLTHGAFAPKHGENVVCVKLPSGPRG